MMNNTIKSLVLCKNTICEIDIPNNLDINKFDENILAYKMQKGKGPIERHCDWEIEDNITMSIFGWKDGIPGTENKNDLPPPEDNSDIFFGDILVIKSKNNEVCNLNTEEFNEFVETALGGFEDLNSNDSIESDDNEIDEYEKNSWLTSDDDYNDEDDEDDDHDDDDDEDDDDDNDDDDDDEDDEDDDDDNDDNNDNNDNNDYDKNEEKLSILTNEL